MSRMRPVTMPILMQVSLESIRSFPEAGTQRRDPECPRLSSRRGDARERTASSINPSGRDLAPPAAPEARTRLRVLLDLAALLHRQDRGRVRDSLRNALADGIHLRDLLG